ncbi:hypothetical protein Poli38472_009520 [Pythium oligandrum]|uniref:Sulfatase N-terminal domain-containing protein n=1 Tax=Pythium oligandrum TaxID=41045 RepID=A0A8K1FJP4_PYTOL|nr:hypothetical protein Poli38472_009520 [Pythium oligandrum]|eukprot:TMW62027.1 hypothetical protein Poli38472_009520 [Pythium oligandrum]
MRRWHVAVARVDAALSLTRKPWRHWLVVYAVLLPYFSIYRCAGLEVGMKVFATRDQNNWATIMAALLLGVCEDLLVVSFLIVLLSLVDYGFGPRVSWTQGNLAPDQDKNHPRPRHRVLEGVRILLRFALSGGLIALLLIPFTADSLVLRLRGLRFTFELIDTYHREMKFAKGMSVGVDEVVLARQTIVITVLVGLLVEFIYLTWLDFSAWNVAQGLTSRPSFETRAKALDEVGKKPKYQTLEEGARSPVVDDLAADNLDEEQISDHTVEVSEDDVALVSLDETKAKTLQRPAFVVIMTTLVLLLPSALLLAFTQNIPAVISALALNGSLNELFRTTINEEFQPQLGDGTIESASQYLSHDTEVYELFKPDVLFRRTKGFKGNLAFNLSVDPENPPNVMVLVVESFRHRDSLYMLGNTTAAFKEQHGITLTPNFDKWAKRGIALRNLWSSWQTSRSLESILFGQVPYDHYVNAGSTGGKPDVKLDGLPQFFAAKGYETTFTSGARIQYDGWDDFLASHGFDEQYGAREVKAIAERDLGISPNDWKDRYYGGWGRGTFWGAHDDISFDVLMEIITNKTAQQQQRLEKKEPKKPFFLTHYTISSHTPWTELPDWFRYHKLPDFSPLFEGHEDEKDTIQRYATLRYFSDYALGKFMDQLKAAGILNDTIVVIVGDHGQSPEFGLHHPENDHIATTRVAGAIIAEGRLEEHAGLIIDDATEHYDILNTLADIVGVPEGGFVQSGVGRSIKRVIPEGTRPVWSNNPLRQLSVVRGHKRLTYDRRFDMMALYDADNDPSEQNDLFPSLTSEEKAEMEELRKAGRRVSQYFKHRWDGKCVSQVEC